MKEVSRQYAELRADVRRFLMSASRAIATQELNAKRITLQNFEEFGGHYYDENAVDAVLQNADAYAEWKESHLAGTKPRREAWLTPRLTMFIALFADDATDRPVRFMREVSSRFVDFHADHALQLRQRADAILVHLERCAAQMPPETVAKMAVRGRDLDIAAQHYASLMEERSA